MRTLLAVLASALVAIAVSTAVPSLASDHSDPIYLQAGHAIQHGDFDAAIRSMDEALGRAPKEAKYRGLRGVALIRKGDYTRGGADLKAAAELNPGDAGVGFRPSTDAALSKDAIRHGEEQLKRMLKDRPPMAGHAEQTAFLRNWAVRKFAGEDFGALIDWDPSPPLHSDAEHLAATADAHAAILVEPNYTAGPDQGKPRSFEELWAGAVYELYNVCYSRNYVRLNDEADKGTISREAFVGGILKDELLAAQRTRAFYIHVFLPWAEKKRLHTDPALWFCDWWDSTDNVLGHFTDKSEYPWVPYGHTYDWAAVHRYWHAGQINAAQKLLKEMQADDGYAGDQSEISLWLGRCLAEQKKPTEAIDAFSESIRLDPENADAYRARASQYKLLGDKAKADADDARAKSLERRQS